MAEMRFLHEIKKINPAEVNNETDPNFPGRFPHDEVRDSEWMNDIP
jgi:hypothetical protein